MIRAEIWLIPAMSTTEYIIVTSTEPTYGLVSPDATVETISFGTPIGSARMAWVTSAEPPEPPSPPTASSRPSAYRRFTISAAPRAIVSTAAPRSPAAASTAGSAPTAAPTSARAISGATSGSPTIPASTSRTSTPRSRMRSARYAYSTLFVSNVPTSTTVATVNLPPSRVARSWRVGDAERELAPRVPPHERLEGVACAVQRERLLDGNGEGAVVEQPGQPREVLRRGDRHHVRAARPVAGGA